MIPSLRLSVAIYFLAPLSLLSWLLNAYVHWIAPSYWLVILYQLRWAWRVLHVHPHTQCSVLMLSLVYLTPSLFTTPSTSYHWYSVYIHHRFFRWSHPWYSLPTSYSVLSQSQVLCSHTILLVLRALHILGTLCSSDLCKQINSIVYPYAARMAARLPSRAQS